MSDGAPRDEARRLPYLAVSFALHAVAAALLVLCATQRRSAETPAHVTLAFAAPAPVLAPDAAAPCVEVVPPPREPFEGPPAESRPEPSAECAEPPASTPDPEFHGVVATIAPGPSDRFPNGPLRGRPPRGPAAGGRSAGAPTGQAAPGPAAASPPTPAPGPTRPVRLGPSPSAPRYPERARALGWEGSVTVRLTVAASGEIVRAEVAASSGREALDDAALAAARGWTAEPALLDGRAVDATLDVVVRFRLED